MSELGDVDVLRALLYGHRRANANTSELCRATATVDALVDVLADRGVVERDAFEERRAQNEQRLRREYLERGMGVAMQEFGVSKYEFDGGVEIDCEARLPLCGAACCRLPLALSAEDVEEGVVRWDLGRPYMIAQGEDGYCVHSESCTHQCGIYEQRPIPCRGYDCRQDGRIWLDFERRIVNPRINDPDWPACLEADQDHCAEIAGTESCSTTSTAH